MMQAKAAKENAKTNIAEYLEKVRHTDYDYEIKRGALELQRFIQDTPESTKLTVGTFGRVIGGVTRKFGF